MADNTPIELLSDDEVLTLANLHMPEEQQQKLSDLLADQREGELSEDERLCLNALMQVYNEGMMQKATAMKVAVERGLISPLG